MSAREKAQVLDAPSSEAWTVCAETFTGSNRASLSMKIEPRRKAPP